MSLLSPIGERPSASKGPDPPGLLPAHLLALAGAAADRLGVPLPYILGIMRRETAGYDASARSRHGAVGLMQVKPSTAGDLRAFRGMDMDVIADQLQDPETNFFAGTEYLAQMHQRFGSWSAAAGAYNVGPGAYQRGARPRAYVSAVSDYARQYEAVLNAPPDAGAGLDVRVSIDPLTIIHRNERGETLGVETVQPHARTASEPRWPLTTSEVDR